MKFFLKYFTVIFLILVPNFSNAQQKVHKNNIELGLGRYCFFNEDFNKRSLYHQTGISYYRTLNNRIKVYSRLILSPYTISNLFYEVRGSSGEGRLMTSINYDNYKNYTPQKGDLYMRLNGCIFDLGASFGVMEKQRNSLSFNIGMGTMSSKNFYLIHIIQVPGYDDAIEKLESKREWYFGGVAGLRYDYSFAKNRMNFGTFCNARVYYDFPFQLNYGIHLGYNF